MTMLSCRRVQRGCVPSRACQSPETWRTWSGWVLVLVLVLVLGLGLGLGLGLVARVRVRV